MYLIVGLGNPGSEFSGTRHNAGFLVANRLAVAANTSFKPGKGEYWQAKCSFKDSEVSLIKPSTHMNNSGIAVREFLENYIVPLENILIICDDFQLPLGAVRIRQNGSDGGHNGLASVIYHLNTDQIARLRCGIGSSVTPKGPSMRDFVLEEFGESEIPSVKEMIKRACDASISFVVDGINQAMNKFNITQQNEVL